MEPISADVAAGVTKSKLYLTKKSRPSGVRNAELAT